MIRGLSILILTFSFVSFAQAKKPRPRSFPPIAIENLAPAPKMTQEQIEALINSQFQKVVAPNEPLQCTPVNQRTHSADDISDAAAIDAISMAIGQGWSTIEYVTKVLRQRPQFKDCGLRDVELFAVNAYTGSHYRAINAALRSPNQYDSQKYAVLIRLINSGLGKLANYRDYTFRGGRLPSEELAKHEIMNNVIPYPSYTSTSRNPNVAKQFGQGSGFYFVYAPKTCKYVAPISNYETEDEVLCMPGTRFEVRGKMQKNSYERYWLMEEVAPAAKASGQ